MEAAFFDLDGTLLSRSATFMLARPMYEAGLVPKRVVMQGLGAQLQFLLFATSEGRLDRAKKGILRLTKGWDVAQVEEIVRSVVLDRVVPYIHLPVRRAVDEHHAAGRAVYLVSSSPELVVRPLAEYFGIDGVIATRPGVADGHYTGELEFYCFGDRKAAAVAEEAAARGIDLSASFAYSDSASDLPMLELVGHPVVVDPDRELRGVASQRGWEVIEAPSRKAVYASAAAGGAVIATIWTFGYGRGKWRSRQKERAEDKDRRKKGRIRRGRLDRERRARNSISL